MAIKKFAHALDSNRSHLHIKSKPFQSIFESARKLYEEFDIMIKKLELSKSEIEENKEKILTSIASFEKNNENSSYIVFYLERSKVSGVVELVSYENLLNEKNGRENTTYPFLVDIDKKGWMASLSSDITMTSDRKKFFKFMQSLLTKELKTTLFVLLGPSWSGKSFLCSYFAHYINKKEGGGSVAYINWNKFTTSWQQTFGSSSFEMISKNEEFSALYNQLFSVPFLFLDDFGMSKMNEWSRDKLWVNLMTEREKNGLITCIISPLTKSDLLKSFWVSNDIQGRMEKSRSFLNGATFTYLKTKYETKKEMQS